MKHKIKGLSQRYLTALGNYLKLGTRGHLQPAMDLGRQSVTFGLKTFELTKIHQRAISNLDVANGSQGQIRRAEFFLSRPIRRWLKRPVRSGRLMPNCEASRETLGNSIRNQLPPNIVGKERLSGPKP